MPAPTLRDRPAVPIAQVGTWMAATGEWTITRDDLQDAVAAQHDPAFRTPILKVGHRDPNWTDGRLLGDGKPAVGRLDNLRLSPDGTQLLADLVGIPPILDDILDTAYPSRSVEALTGVETAAGARYRMVVTGLALLGETVPAMETLGDLADLFGVPRDVDTYTAAAQVAASIPMEGGVMPVRALGQVVASASLDELYTAAESWAKTQEVLGGDAWVRDIYTDTVIFTAWLPGGESRMYRCGWTETDGAFTFGELERVRPTYEPVPDGQSGQAAASAATPWPVHDVTLCRLRSGPDGAVPSARGRDVVTAGAAHPKETRVPLSPAQAELLGVEPDADEAAVEAAIRALREKADAPPPATEHQEGGTTSTPAPAPTADVEALVAAATARIEQKYGSVIAAQSAELASIKAEKAKETKDSIIGAAIASGKIKPAERAAWEKDYDEAPGVVASLLNRIEPGTAVPVNAAGHTGGEVTGLDAEAEALHTEYKSLLAGGR